MYFYYTIEVSIYTYFIKNFSHKWIYAFIKCIFYIHGEDSRFSNSEQDLLGIMYFIL